MIRLTKSYRGAMASNMACTAYCLSAPVGNSLVSHRRLFTVTVCPEQPTMQTISPACPSGYRPLEHDLARLRYRKPLLDPGENVFSVGSGTIVS